MNAPVKAPPKAKTPSPIAEAERLRVALARIDTREAAVLASAQERYQAERNALMETASAAAQRILEASKSDLAG